MTALIRYLIGIVFGVGMLFSLTACAPPLWDEEKILEILTKRYESEFVIVETLKDDLTHSSNVLKSKLYAVAPKDDPSNIFWVQQEVVKDGGIFVTYGHVVEDTLTFDYFVKQLHNFLQEKNISFYYEIQNVEIDVSEHLSQPHGQGGSFFVFFTEDTAEDIVNQIFDFTENLDMECFHDEIKDMRILILFLDESKLINNEVDSMMLPPRFYPYDENLRHNDRESVLAEINETFYEHK